MKALGVLKRLHRKSTSVFSTTWSQLVVSPHAAPCPACPLVMRSSGAHTVWSTKTKKCLKQTKQNHAKWCETETKNIGDIGVNRSKSKTSTLGLDLSSAGSTEFPESSSGPAKDQSVGVRQFNTRHLARFCGEQGKLQQSQHNIYIYIYIPSNQIIC